MALKTDYKDYVYSGNQKFKITANSDGTSTITDSTTYSQVGDTFGASDLNATNEAVNALDTGKISMGLDVTGTLSAGSTSITLSSSKITTSSILDFYTSIYGVSPSEVVVSSGKVVLTFDSQDSAMVVGVKIIGTY